MQDSFPGWEIYLSIGCIYMVDMQLSKEFVG